MIEIYNNKLVVKDQPTICRLLNYLTFRYDEPDDTKESILRAYVLDDNKVMTVPRGLLEFLPSSMERVDKSTSELGDISADDIDNILEGITLRYDQVLAVQKMTGARRGIIQMATGSGKTECLSAFLLNIKNKLGYYPPTLILEPTTHLVKSTISRMNKYGIPAEEYSEVRGSKVSGVVVTHPMSLNNDLKKDDSILEDIKIFLTDECHRLSAHTWHTLINSMNSVEYSLGVSASAIYPTRVPVKDLSILESEEVKIVGATGNVIYNVPPSYYISKGILASPVLFRVTNSANESYANYRKNWTQIRKRVLESTARSNRISEVTAFYATSGFKVLILVGTKVHAFKIMKRLSELGLGESCRCSFGGGIYYRHDTVKDKPIQCKKSEDVFEGFESGQYSILIGTSHIYEGMDVPNLDVVVLGSIGKKLRRVIQGIGRAIRKSKTGNHAYIIDFTDHNNPVLRSHSLHRATICREIIGVPDNYIFGNVDLATLKSIVFSLEKEHYSKALNH